MATFLNSKAILDNSITLDKIGESVEWAPTFHINDFQNPGFFKITGTRSNPNDGLPIYNTGNIEAQLLVLKNDDNNISQTLTLLNVGGGDTNVYVRTYQNGEWDAWGKMQTNIEVGAIGYGQSQSFDDFTDNGMYSGMNYYQLPNSYEYAVEVFVLVVTNNYLYYGDGAYVTQLKYSTLADGTVNVQTRRRYKGTWTEWHKFNEIEKIIEDAALNDDPNKFVLNKTLEPNIYYMFNNVSTAFISFGTNKGTNFNNYMFEMMVVNSPNGNLGEFILPTINWANGLAPSFKAGKTYQISVINNLGVFAEF